MASRTRGKRDFGTIRKRSNGRWQAFYMGPDQGFHRAPSTFETKMDAEAWLCCRTTSARRRSRGELRW